MTRFKGLSFPLETTFPFFIELDNELRVVRIGPSVAKILPYLKLGQSLAQTLFVRRPVVDLNYESIRRQSRVTFILESTNGTIDLRGQFAFTDEAVLFLGSPWTCLADLLDTQKLHLSDFAPHDACIENVFVNQTRDMQLNEFKQVVRELESSVKESERLAKVEQQLAKQLNTAVDLRVRFSDSGAILDASATNPELLPSESSSLVEQPICEVFPCVTTAALAAAQALSIDSAPIAFDYTLYDSGKPRFMAARIARTNDDELLLVVRDVSEYRKLEEQLKHQANHDPLTGLANRILFEERVQSSMESGDPAAVLFVDLDDFKMINDSFGHATGDALLRVVAERIKKNVKSTDTAARLGGDEFGVLIHSLNSFEESEIVAKRLSERICQPFSYGGIQIKVASSIGVANSKNTANFATLFRNADLAMYAAKTDPSRRYAIYSEDMSAGINARLKLNEDIESAISNQEFLNHYQPIIDLSTGQINGFEALVRWQHPTKGLLYPGDFIDAAESSGAIVEIGNNVLHEACREIKYLNTLLETDYRLHVNLSALQVGHREALNRIESAISESELPTELLTLEITETALIADFGQAETLFHTIRDMGIGVALDDFGTGYSSLKYLERFPITSLKLDRSYVGKLGSVDDRQSRLVRPIIDFGKALGLNVVAEGVENEQHHELLKDFQCDYAQGYLYSRPVPFGKLTSLIEDLNQSQKPEFAPIP